MVSGRIYVTNDKIVCGSYSGSGAVLYPQSPLDSGIPSGIIAMWSGPHTNIPDGWFLCDGQNGTPDLRNRFIVGAGTSYDVGDTGGSENVKLTAEQMPSHTHGNNFSVSMSGLSVQIRPVGDSGSNLAASIYSSMYDIESWETVSNIRVSGSGSLTGSISSTGGSQAHENRPPYYALCFIMKS